jgi:hypothetical protein
LPGIAVRVGQQQMRIRVHTHEPHGTNVQASLFQDLTRAGLGRKVSIALRQIVRCNSGTNPVVTALADNGQAWPTTEPASRGRCGG